MDELVLDTANLTSVTTGSVVSSSTTLVLYSVDSSFTTVVMLGSVDGTCIYDNDCSSAVLLDPYTESTLPRFSSECCISNEDASIEPPSNRGGSNTARNVVAPMTSNIAHSGGPGTEVASEDVEFIMASNVARSGGPGTEVTSKYVGFIMASNVARLGGPGYNMLLSPPILGR